MTYELKLSDAARTALATLAFDLQEAVWDLLELLVHEAGGRTSRGRVEVEAHRVLIRQPEGAELFVDAGFVIDHDARIVNLVLVTFTDSAE